MGKSFIDRGRGLHAETVQSALTIILKLAIGGLISVMLIVLGTVSLQFQGCIVSISLRLILRIVATCEEESIEIGNSLHVGGQR